MPNSVTYASTDTPQTIGIGATLSDNIIVPAGQAPNDNLVVLTVNVQITAPNEGNGIDYTLLGVTLINNYSNGAIESAVLQTGSINSLSNFTFPTNGGPLQSFGVFNGLPAVGTWTLQILNVSQIASATLTAWSLTITYPNTVSSTNPSFPGSANPRAIPAALAYGKGGSVKQNNKLYFNFPGNVYVRNLLDNVKVSNINGFARDLRVSCVNTGSTSSLQMSLHRVRSGVDTVFAQSTIGLPSGLVWTTVLFPTYSPNLYSIAIGDLVYLTVDSVGTGVQNLSVALVLNGN